MDRKQTKKRCVEAARAIGTMARDEWPSWVFLILEELEEQRCDVGETWSYEDLLRAIRDDIEARLITGEWSE
jgi:hypothetical protein